MTSTSAEQTEAIKKTMQDKEAAKDEVIRKLKKAVSAVTDATAAYLPPDGISASECISRILGATDNPEINSIMLEKIKAVREIEAPYEHVCAALRKAGAL